MAPIEIASRDSLTPDQVALLVRGRPEARDASRVHLPRVAMYVPRCAAGRSLGGCCEAPTILPTWSRSTRTPESRISRPLGPPPDLAEIRIAPPGRHPCP